MTAFGKNPQLLRSIPSFRQLSGQFNGGRSSRQGKGGTPYFIDQYKPPPIEPDTIALLAGNFESMEVDDSGEAPKAIAVTLPYVKFTEHYDGRTEKSAICSAGPFVRYKDLRDACNGCDIYWATLEPGDDGKKHSRMSRQTKFGFSIIDFSDYHKEPQFDTQTSRPRVNPKTKEPYFNWVKCGGLGCDACKANLPKKFAHNPHWPMSWGYFQTIREQDREIGKSCRACGGIDTLQCVAWTCQGCGEAAIDMSSTGLKMEDVIKISESHYTCKCGVTDFLQEIIECRACSKAERMTVFDVEFRVKRIPTGQNNQSMLNISGWAQRRKLEGPLAEYASPKDLIKIFKPTDHRVQLDRFGPPPISAEGEPGAPPKEQSRDYGTQYR